MTPQEVFDTVVTHLIKQGKRSTDTNERCLYRGPDGLKCAVGCLIPDNEYSRSLEGRGVRELGPLAEVLKLKTVAELVQEHADLLNRLQQLHDAAGNWNTKGLSHYAYINLSKIAADYNLTFTPPSNFEE